MVLSPCTLVNPTRPLTCVEEVFCAYAQLWYHPRIQCHLHWLLLASNHRQPMSNLPIGKLITPSILIGNTNINIYTTHLPSLMADSLANVRTNLQQRPDLWWGIGQRIDISSVSLLRKLSIFRRVRQKLIRKPIAVRDMMLVCTWPVTII